VAYLVMWWIVPPVKTESDRLKLNGKPITVDNIKEAVTGAVERADFPAAAHRVAGAVERLAHFIVRGVLGIVGLIFVILGMAALFGAAAAGTYALVRGYTLGGVNLFPVGTEEKLAVVCGFAVVAVIAILWLFAGVAMMRRKQGLPGWALASLIAIFVAAGAGGAVTITDSVPAVRDRYATIQHTEVRQLGKYTSADIQLGNVDYVVAAEASGARPVYRLDIQTLGKIDTHNITAVVKDGKLVVRTGALAHNHSCALICPYGNANVRVIIYQPENVNMTINGMDYPAESPAAPVTPATPITPATPQTTTPSAT
jgi:hypothetical protein